MHELSLAESVVEIAGRAAKAEGSARVTKVFLQIGALAHVEPEALRFAFDAASRGSVAEGAEVIIEHVAGKALCVPCGLPIEVNSRADPCPRCGGHEWVVADGEQMRVTELEVE